ncbi:hypothetical protein ACFQ1S_14520 [Kibdelosporangium lantanae]|uniref:FtsK domain-containing protein n=1 Tax=Kibdelosporangium lantanae TaxID=1497396 RepID=A0ABW3MAQ6_9PSEU
MARNTFGNGLIAWLFEFLIDLAGLIIVWATKILARMSWWLLRKAVTHPRTSLAAGILGGAVYLVGWEIVVGILGVLVLSGSVWKAADRAAFDRWVGDWLVSWHRKWWVYRRTWNRVMARCGLTVDVDGERHVPKLTGVKQGKYWDKLTIGIEVGQEPDDYLGAAQKLRHAFQAVRADVRELAPASVVVNLMHKDPFRHEVVEAAAMPASTADIDWDRIPLGLTEHLERWTTPMRGGHLAVCGGTNSGKGSIVGNILRGLAPAIADGTVVTVAAEVPGRNSRPDPRTAGREVQPG